jgi:hypothetical protein
MRDRLSLLSPLQIPSVINPSAIVKILAQTLHHIPIQRFAMHRQLLPKH